VGVPRQGKAWQLVRSQDTAGPSSLQVSQLAGCAVLTNPCSCPALSCRTRQPHTKGAVEKPLGI
jgi:hypothetical protein